MSQRVRCVFVWVIAGVLAGCASSDPRFVDPRSQLVSEPACRELAFVSTGAAFPEDETTLAIRWAGYANFELAYKGQILLLDAFFDRGPDYTPLGFSAADVVRADAILLGHGHRDHMLDAGSIARRTGAVVVGAAPTIEALLSDGFEEGRTQTVTGRGGEVLQVGEYTIEPILARHGEPPGEVTGPLRAALASVTDGRIPDREAELPDAPVTTASGPRVIDEGTIAYMITLDNGFRLLFRDSGGRVTEFERGAAERAGAVDVMLAPTAAAYLNTLTAEQALEYVRTYRPRVFIPGHHDAPYTNLWRATEPLFQAIKDEDPSVVTVSRSYREPICFDTEARY